MKGKPRKDNTFSTHDQAMKVFDQQPLDRLTRLLNNSRKAIEEHKKKARLQSYVYANVEEVIPSIESAISLEPLPPISFTHSTREEQGDFRESMEDAHFFRTIPQGVLAGVFDGHGGIEIADYSCSEFRTNFSKFLRKNKNDVRNAFEDQFNTIHEAVKERIEWNKCGSTAVICFIQKDTNLIYTATLGDSEANIYRRINGRLKSIPLSCVRDWSSPKDAKRAAAALNDPTIAVDWPKTEDPKSLRYPSVFQGVNISRSIGDVKYAVAVSHTPKITLNRIFKGDILVLACDGLKDYVDERTIIELIERSLEENTNTTNVLVDHAINTAISEDNVTVMVIKAT